MGIEDAIGKQFGISNEKMKKRSNGPPCWGLKLPIQLSTKAPDSSDDLIQYIVNTLIPVQG